MAVGDTTTPLLVGAVVATDNSGHSWAAVPAPPGAVDVVGVQCPAAGLCVVVATNGGAYFTASTVDDGATWQQGGTLPAGFGGVSGMFCSEGGQCLVAGYAAAAPGHGVGAIARSTDGGTTWSLATVPPNLGLLHSVSCGATTCLAVGTTSSVTSAVAPGQGLVLASTDGGATFATRATPPEIDDGLGVSCPAPNRCTVVGTHWTQTIPGTPLPAVATTDDLGTTFTVPTKEFLPNSLVAVACPTTRVCAAAGGGVLATVTLPPPVRHGSRRR
jgi:photosystem II stability/assembly factor-like uncharacterized protein